MQHIMGKSRLCRWLLATVLVLALCLAGISLAMAREDDAATVTVCAVKANEDGTFIMQPTEVQVSAGLAKEYGYEVPETTSHQTAENRVAIDFPTFFDALVAAHKAFYGADFTADTAEDYLTISGNFMGMAFGGSFDSSSGMVINDKYPLLEAGWGAGYADAKIEDGDFLVLFAYGDTTTYGDYYAYFNQKSLTVNAGGDIALTLLGYSYMFEGYSNPAGTAFADADFYWVDATDGSFEAEAVVKTAYNTETGAFVLTAPSQAGTYLLTASCTATGDYPGTLPACVVTVNTAPTRAENVSATATASIKTGESYTLSLDTIFTDADQDTLTYKVAINAASGVPAAADYSFTPTAAGSYTLVFTANDGSVNSTDTYTVTLTVTQSTSATLYSFNLYTPPGSTEFNLPTTSSANLYRMPYLEDSLGSRIDLNNRANGSKPYTAQLAPGTYYYVILNSSNEVSIKRPFTVADSGDATAAQNLYLREVNFSFQYSSDITAEYNCAATVTLTDPNGATVAGVRSENSNMPNPDGKSSFTYSYIVEALGLDQVYTYSVDMADEGLLLEEDTGSLSWEVKKSSNRVPVVIRPYPAANEVVFRVTKDAGLGVYRKLSGHYAAFYEYEAASIDTTTDAGYDIYTYNIPQRFTGNIHVVCGGSEGDSDRIKTARIFDSFTVENDDSTSESMISYTFDLEKRNNADRRDCIFATQFGAERTPLYETVEADMFLNVPDSNYIELSDDDVFALRAYRVNQAQKGETANYFIEPDFHYEILSGSSVEISPEGNPGNEYAILIPTGTAGVTLIRVTYDAMLLRHGSSDYAYYNACDTLNERIIAVNVDGSGTVESGITEREYDTVYYAGTIIMPDGAEVAGTEYAELTFTPTAGAEVSVHAPLNGAAWTDTWTDYEAAMDGSFTVRLTSGENIVRISKDSAVTYYMVSAKEITVSVTNVTNPGQALCVGDTVTVSFDTLNLPNKKMAGIYNPGYPDTTWTYYHCASEQCSQEGLLPGAKVTDGLVRNGGSQYIIASKLANGITFRVCVAGELTLTQGGIHSEHFGAVLDTHRLLDGTGMPANTNASNNSANADFSRLPDLTLTVSQPEPDNRIPALAANVSPTAQANVIVGQPWKVELSSLFTDADGDTLTYQVKLGAGEYTPLTGSSYAYAPTATGSTTLTFRANDSQAASTDTYTVTLTAYAVETSNVTLSLQDENQFLLMPQSVAVASDLAESYGYADGLYDSVSALDVLVKLHEILLDSEFTRANATTYLAVSSGSISRVCGEDTYAFSFALDGEYPCDPNGAYGSPLTGGWGYTGYTIDQAPVADGGAVEFFFYQDSMYMDYYTWFAQAGSRVGCITVTAGQSFSLNLQGYMYMFGSYNEADRIATGAFSVIDEAQLALVDQETGALTPLTPVVTDEDGNATLSLSQAGTYILSAYTDYDETDTAIFSPWLEVKVLADVGSTDLDADWKNFRNSDVNMAITDGATPQSRELTQLLWNNKLGTGWTASPSPQLIVDDTLIVMCGATLYQLDLNSGEVLRSSTMVAAPSYSNTPPTYADGMIFCPLANGRIQAFDADTLESLWVYTDALGGQALSPITYSDGYLYTGFWNGETGKAAYVCVSATDESPSATDEAKSASWRDERVGGFYWAGSVVVDDAVIYGGDNGDGVTNADGSGSLVSRNKVSGALLSSLELIGDQRSSIAYADGRIYCTTKSGYLYSAAVSREGLLSDLKSNQLGAQSTSTPVVYKDRVYLGCGSGISSTGSSGNLLVCQADTLETLYAVGMIGYPQCSLLLSTAYEQAEGYLYLYATYNMTPGGVSLIKVKADATTAADAQLIEIYDAAGYSNYCICSVICGSDGTLYYKNDSGNVFALQAQFPISTDANSHGLIAVTAGGQEVTKAPVGTALSVAVTANTGWTLQSLTLNGKTLAVTQGAAAFTMPQGGANLVANYIQDVSGVQVEETESQATLADSLSGLKETEKEALLSAAQSAVVSGLATAGDELAGELAKRYPNQQLRIEFYLDVTVQDVQVSGSSITRLTLDITPKYALYLDGSDTAVAGGTVENEKLNSAVTVTLPVPEGMTVNAYTRIQHGEDWLTPKIKTEDSHTELIFTLSHFSEVVVYADGRVAAVTFDPEGGKLNGSTAKETADYYPENVGDELPIPSRSGYTFQGWYRDAAGSGSQYTTVSSELPATLHAVWKVKDGILVSFRLIGDWQHSNGVNGHEAYVTWIKTTGYTLSEGSTVGDLFTLALADAGLSSKGASTGYVSSIKAPAEFGGYWLSEFDNGNNSGWMYTVNGDHPDKSLNSYVLKDGDKVIWHYVDDYTLESASEWSGGSSKYLNRWLEAEDITPAQYIRKHGDTSLILQVGAGGSVSPSGTKLEDYLGKNVTFTITPDKGYQIQDVVVDGKSVGAVSSYTYKDLTEDSRIKVTFTPIPQTKEFPDVPASHWAYSYINSLAADGVVDGYPNGYFYPDATVKRADFVVMLARLSGQTLPAYTGQFHDVDVNAYYAKAVAWAAAAGVTTGDGKGGFQPEALITRQDMAAMLYRYANYMKLTLATGGTASFGDGDAIASYALAAVNAMWKSGIINGYPDGSFKPTGNATRGEAAKMMYLLNSYR